MSVFGPAYAQIYDSLYEDKDYGADVNGLVRELAEANITPPARILDLGCGTGRHIELLKHEGYEVTGVDTSDAMLHQARLRLGSDTQLFTPKEFLATSLLFDAAYSLFDVLSYQTSLRAVLDFVHVLVHRVRSGGLVVADAWHQAGMKQSPPGPRQLDLSLPDGSRMRRRVLPSVDWVTGTVHLDICLAPLLPSGKSDTTHEVSETHILRAFTQFELELIAEHSRLQNPRFYSSVKDLEPISDLDWHITMVAEVS